MSGNQTQIPVIQTKDASIVQLQQNTNKVLRNLHNQINETNSFQAYSPVITNCGTPTTLSFLFKQDNDLLTILGTFTLLAGGTLPIGIPLPSGFTSSKDLATYQMSGSGGINVNGPLPIASLIGPSADQLFLGIGVAGQKILTPTTGNILGGAGIIISINALIPLTL